jgi:hypothetical protein
MNQFYRYLMTSQQTSLTSLSIGQGGFQHLSSIMVLLVIIVERLQLLVHAGTAQSALIMIFAAIASHRRPRSTAVTSPTMTSSVFSLKEREKEKEKEQDKARQDLVSVYQMDSLALCIVHLTK